MFRIMRIYPLQTGRALLCWTVALLLIAMPPAQPMAADAEPRSHWNWVSVADGGTLVVHLYFFWSERCPHCLEARPFISKLAQETPWLEVHDLEVSGNRDNAALYIAMARSLNERAESVPAFLFCERMVVGYGDESTSGRQLADSLAQCFANVSASADLSASAADVPVYVPLIGELDTARWSLPALTIVLALLDSFNPCAFFVLLFLLSLLVHADSRVRILWVGGTFILTAGLVYFLFMGAWLNLFFVIGQSAWITSAAGAVAVLIGAINAKDFFWFKKGVSLSIPESAKPGIFKRARGLLEARSLGAIMFGTIVLATAANSYELLCTAGFPMIYTRALTLNPLSTSQYYLYLLAYNVIYILPLLLIVALFALTLGARKLSEREGRLLKLVSGLMMLELGLVLLLAPNLLASAATAVGLLATAVLGGWAIARVTHFST